MTKTKFDKILESLLNSFLNDVSVQMFKKDGVRVLFSASVKSDFVTIHISSSTRIGENIQYVRFEKSSFLSNSKINDKALNDILKEVVAGARSLYLNQQGNQNEDRKKHA